MMNLNQLQDLKSGSLRLGVTKALSQYLMPAVIANFQDRHPHLSIHLAEGSFNMDICIIHLKGKTLSPAAAAFVSFLQENKGARTLTKLVDDLVK